MKRHFREKKQHSTSKNTETGSTGYGEIQKLVLRRTKDEQKGVVLDMLRNISPTRWQRIQQIWPSPGVPLYSYEPVFPQIAHLLSNVRCLKVFQSSLVLGNLGVRKWQLIIKFIMEFLLFFKNKGCLENVFKYIWSYDKSQNVNTPWISNI